MHGSWSHKYLISGLLGLILAISCIGQRAKPYDWQWQDNGEFILAELEKRPWQFRGILDSLELREIQIIYTKIDRSGPGAPKLTHYRFGEDPGNWFAPASLVKLPTAALALEKVRILSDMGISRDSRMLTLADHACQKEARSDETSETGYPSVGHYIRKIFLVSDNDAYSRLYELVGQQFLNSRLHSLGYPQARVMRRFARCDLEENRYTNPIEFRDNQGKLLYRQPPAFNTETYKPPVGEVWKGIAHENPEGDIVPGPMEFTHRNYIPLRDLHLMMISLILPESVPEDRRFSLRQEDYTFLRECMSTLPRESKFPSYDEEEYPDSYVKYFLFGDMKGRIPDEFEIFNKVGQSYGYLSDVAYIRNEAEGVEFFLSAVIYVNANQTMNDGVYEYDSVGLPFLSNLGQTMYEISEK